MRKFILLLLLALPVALSAQWSIVPSATVGQSKYIRSSYNTGGKMGYSISAVARYSLGMFFASTGVGYQDFKAESEKINVIFPNQDDSGTSAFHYPNHEYSDIYIPVSVGFKLSKYRLYPIAETGVNIAFPTKFDKVGTYLAKNVMMSFFAKAGAGYRITDAIGVEAKFRYLKTGDITKSSGKYIIYDCSWQHIGLQVSLVVNL